MRKVIVHPERNGYVYVLDRKTGQVLSATPFVRITSSKGVDLTTGKLIHNDEKKPADGQGDPRRRPDRPRRQGLAAVGLLAADRAGLHPPPDDVDGLTRGSRRTTSPARPTSAPTSRCTPTRSTPATAAGARSPPGTRSARRPTWKIKEKFPVWSGALATAGDVVFYGTMEGWFKAVDARKGDLLWQFKTGSGIIGQPVTYRGPDGKQYVADPLRASAAGPGRSSSRGLDPSDPTAAKGFANAMKDLPDHTTKGGTLYVFSLP